MLSQLLPNQVTSPTGHGQAESFLMGSEASVHKENVGADSAACALSLYHTALLQKWRCPSFQRINICNFVFLKAFSIHAMWKVKNKIKEI